MRVITMFRDPTDGIINQRIVMKGMEVLEQTDLNDADKGEFINLLIHIGWKMVCVWTHFSRYSSVEDKLIEVVEAGPCIDTQEVQHIQYSQELFMEVDEYLTQLKSALDYVVKVPVPVLGPRAWPLRTFADKGEGVVRALRNNVPKKYHEKAYGIEEMVVRKHIPWLTEVVAKRDALNHYLDGGVHLDGFVVLKLMRDGKEIVHVPMWDDGHTTREVMEITWHNLVVLVEDFVVSVLNFRLKEGLNLLHLKSVRGSPESPWQVLNNEEYEKAVARLKLNVEVRPK